MFQKIKYLFFVWKNNIHLKHMSGKSIYFSDLNFWKSLENETSQTIVNPEVTDGYLLNFQDSLESLII